MAAAVLTLRAQLASRFDTAFGIRTKSDCQYLATGFEAVDRMLHGGIPRATLSEIAGALSTGRTTLMTALLANATKAGEACVWVDAAGSFDPASAAENGALLERLLWVNCEGNAQHALKTTDLFIQAGGFGLVVLDLGETPWEVSRRIPLASWFRLRHAAEASSAALVVLGQQVNARSCSSVQLETQRREISWRGRLLRGLHAEAQSLRHQMRGTAEFIVQR